MKHYLTEVKKTGMLADLITPVGIYLRLRDIYPNSLLLESSDYHGNENSYSFICLKPVATFRVVKGIIDEMYPDGSTLQTPLSGNKVFIRRFSEFFNSFESPDITKEIPVDGLFGYTCYDMIGHFEKINLGSSETPQSEIPGACYSFFNYIIAVNHFLNKLYIIDNQVNSQPGETEKISALINSRNIAVYSFKAEGGEHSSITDDEYKSIVTRGKEHCHKGDVFQVVLSRQFSQSYKGDDFNVYRALRSVNPSPYLFYFDYGNFRLFGSSPEAHLKINDRKARINPIAGTFRRTGDDEKDKDLARKLAADPKENAEHIMLVDLARNDLSRHAHNIKVESLREVQFYSHVIHLVSSVSGEMDDKTSMTEMMAATFPAGTLTGAPKYRAMQIIDELEGKKRGYYGGAIGYIDFRGNFNHAIMIRTFLSKGNTLYYQAGAGIVAASDEENELQEVANKTGALRKAIELAATIR